LVNVLAAFLIDALIPHTITDPTPLVIMLTTVVIFHSLANLAIAMFATILFPLLVVRLYRTIAGPGALRAAPAGDEAFDDRAAMGSRGRVAAAAAAAVLLALAGAAYFLQSTLDSEDHAEIIAHRGGAAVAPENTMAAFQRAIADGADWIELDVQEDADGEVVVVHDRDYMRVGKLGRDVADARLSDLREIDIGGFFDAKFADQRVPSLRDVLELARGRIGLFIELKYYGRQRELEQRVVALVEAAGMAPNVVVMSLDYAGVTRAAALRPGWTHGLLSAVAIGDRTRLDVDFIAIAARGATRSTIRRAHDRGMKVYAWTINDPVQMWVMLSRGVDGIITDHVAVARQVQDLRRKVTPFGRFVIWMAAESGLLRGSNFSSVADDA
jgi:glycerophosphoryl diester phosphodiesterase